MDKTKIKIKRHPKRTIYCPLCGKCVTKEGPAKHFEECHKEYAFRIENGHYYCARCGASFSSFGSQKRSLILHYKTSHGMKPKLHSSQGLVKRSNLTRNCPICGLYVARYGPRGSKGGPAEHFRDNHPELRFHTERKPRKGRPQGGIVYKCDICGGGFTSFGDGQGSLLKHYKDYHRNRIEHLLNKEEPMNGSLPEDNTTRQPEKPFGPIDQLLEQVDRNTQLLKESQEKVRVLEEGMADKVASYAARIVELQNQLATQPTLAARPVLVVRNTQHKTCGIAPNLTNQPQSFTAYTENEHGEQVVFQYSYSTHTGQLFYGDHSWESPVPVEDGSCKLVLSAQEREWLYCVWRLATSRTYWWQRKGN